MPEMSINFSDEFWQWIPALLGMPLEKSSLQLRRRPWATWILSLVILAISLFAFTKLEAAVSAFGLVPAEMWRMGGLTMITSFFLHGGPMHLIGNLYFLLLFGDNVEDHLGWGKYFLLLLCATVLGGLCHILIDPSSTVPCIGASGGISGVIAFYALRFPHAKLSLMFLVLFRPVWLQLSAFWMFMIWILLQCLTTWQQANGFSHVSGGAHLGGAFAGFILWLIWKKTGLQSVKGRASLI